MSKKIVSKADSTKQESTSFHSDRPLRRLSEGNTQEMRRQAMGRRRFILDEIKAYGNVSEVKLRQRFPTVHQESIRQDIEFFNGLGIQIAKRKDGSLYDSAASRTEENKGYGEQNIAEKHLVAAMVQSLIVGFEEIDHDALKSTEEDDSVSVFDDYPLMGIGATMDVSLGPKYRKLEAQKKRRELKNQIGHKQILQDGASHLRDCDAIVSAIKSQSIVTKNPIAIDNPTCSSLINKLKDYWQENIRMCMLDSGTTNELLARQLARLSYPYKNTNLSHLSVCTNNRTIFQTLGDPDVPIRTIIIGGQQRGRTSTVAGALAEYFLRGATQMSFGICVVGSTNIAVEGGNCFSDSQEEAILKSVAFSKSSLRIVALNSSKLTRNPVRGGYAFAALNERSIDAIVTNVPLEIEHFDGATEAERERHQRLIDDFWKMVDEIRSRQVNVILASDDRFCIKRDVKATA